MIPLVAVVVVVAATYRKTAVVVIVTVRGMMIRTRMILDPG